MEEDLDRMERYQDFSRTVTALGSTLRERLSNLAVGAPLTPYSMFPDLGVPETPMESISGAMRRFLHTFGEAASIFVSLYLIFNVLRNMGTWVHNLIILKKHHGWLGAMLRTCCIKCFLVEAYRDSPQGQYARESHQQEQQYQQRARQENKKEVQRLRESVQEELLRQQFSRIAPLSPPLASSTPILENSIYPGLPHVLPTAPTTAQTSVPLFTFMQRNTTI